MKKFLIFLLFAALVTGIFLTIYVTVHQSYRQGANNPQIQIAEDAAAALASGAVAEDVIPKNLVNLNISLAPFLAVYNSAGEVVSSNASLDGRAPKVPKGVLDYAKARGQNRVTWQPAVSRLNSLPDTVVRQAIVVVPYTYGDQSEFVVAGRSLREVEKQTAMLTMEIAVAWVAALVICAIIAIFGFTSSKSSN